MQPKALKPALPALLLPFLALACPAQTYSGVAHPEQGTNAVQTDHYVKPSSRVAAASQTPPPAYQDSYPATGTVPAQPVLLPREAMPAPAQAPASISEAHAVPMSAETIALPGAGSATDPADGEIVLEAPSRPHELHRGTLLHARLREALNTKTTPEGATFTAELIEDVGHHGEVMLPAGSLIRGHISSIHGGKRISGGAAMHLRPETVSLPDGTLYRLDAQLTAIDSAQDLRVNDEGTVVLHSNAKAAVAVIGGVTATAAVTGAVVGGGVGAAVGAIAGAGVGTAVYLKREVQENLPRGANVIFALDQPLVVTPR